MRMKRLNLLRDIFIFTCGLIAVSVGISLMVRANIGISVASSMPYVISLRFSQVTFGTWSYIVQGILILLLIGIVRKVKLSFFLSFLVSVLFGLFVDLFVWLTQPFDGATLIWRSFFFVLGLASLSLGIAAIVFSRLPPIPFDLFVNEIAKHRNITFRRVKTIFDLCCLSFSCLFLLVFVQRFSGIGIGTVLAALLNGSLVGFWLGLFERHWGGKVPKPAVRPVE